MYGRNLKAYQKTTVTAEISVADPYYVTKLLFQGVFERLAQAKGAIERGDLALKAKKLSSATAIIENLRSTLDFSQSQSIAQSLFDIYSYMLDQIADASIMVDTKPIDNAISSVEMEMPLEMIAVDIHDAFDKLGEIIGVTYKDELLDELFSSSCSSR